MMVQVMVAFNQANNAKVDQSAVDLNKCDQSGAGEFLSCDNFASKMYMYPKQTQLQVMVANQANNAKVDQECS